MKVIGTYVVAVASAVALTVFSLIAPGLTGFESESNNDLMQKAGDLSLIVGLTYAIIFAIACCVAALPFAIVLRLARAWVSGHVAAAIAGCAAAAVVLATLVVSGWTWNDAEATRAGSFVQFLPSTLVSGLLGGIVYALAMREAESSGP